MRRTTICLVGLAALAGCSKTPAGGQAAPAAVQPSAAVLPFQRPHPKAGLWRMALTTDAGPGITVTGETCIDAATERSVFMANPRDHAGNCDEPRFSANPGGGIVFDETCKLNTRTVVSHGVATGDFSNAYDLDVTSRMDPPIAGGVATNHSRIQAQWEGPCKPGQKPGQMSNVHLAGIGRG
jgi:hypothetical protein